MNTNVLALLQGLFAALQFINAGLGVTLTGPHKLLIVLMIGGITAGFQVALQIIGNKTVPK